MKKVIIRCFANILGFYIAGVLFPTIITSSLETIFLAGIVLGVLNIVIRPLLLLICLPLNFITLGLFTFIINTLLVIMTEHLISGLYIPSFLLSFATAFIISVANIITSRALRF
ncbi:MAG: rane protein of unknown function [Firmicutes bacterium]|nr:rane protein of unknown function [Bacillota bacterium]